MTRLRLYSQHVLLLLMLVLVPIAAVADIDPDAIPADCRTTVRLNLRAGPSARAAVKAVAKEGEPLIVTALCGDSGEWAQVTWHDQSLYAATRYLVTDAQKAAPETPRNSTRSLLKWLWGKAWNLLWLCVALYILRWIIMAGLGMFATIAYKLYWVACLPFYFLNWLQRYASKPWRWLYKRNGGNDYRNRRLREGLEWAKVPLYIVLTPLRFLNAFYYNVMVHCVFELMNYVLEVIDPSYDREGADDSARWVVWLPWRVVKYVGWHGTLTFIESWVWTLVDTFVPALTLYHGTDEAASSSITQSRGRVGNDSWFTGVWNVGGGNYAGNGIYFAPDRSTALHYSSGSLIVCRVTLGRVIDLGLAPKRIYDECGHPNALGATRWGLDNGYVTGEWWRKDEGWWEYCMYDWKNRYNFSWRIRPLYVLSLSDGMLQRIPGGMHHWLFRRMVAADLMTTLGQLLDD